MCSVTFQIRSDVAFGGARKAEQDPPHVVKGIVTKMHADRYAAIVRHPHLIEMMVVGILMEVPPQFMYQHRRLYLSLDALLCPPKVACEKSDQETICSVCLERCCYEPPRLEGSNAAALPCTVLPCGHCFHDACLHRWFDYDSTCPVCRMDMATVAEGGRLDMAVAAMG